MNIFGFYVSECVKLTWVNTVYYIEFINHIYKYIKITIFNVYNKQVLEWWEFWKPTGFFFHFNTPPGPDWFSLLHINTWIIILTNHKMSWKYKIILHSIIKSNCLWKLSRDLFCEYLSYLLLAEQVVKIVILGMSSSF